jgi:hypothetical protein
MWIVNLALRRPYTFIVLAIFILISGGLAILRTPKDIFPGIKIPVIAVIWTYTGMKPTEITGHVTSVYERVLTTHHRCSDHDLRPNNGQLYSVPLLPLLPFVQIFFVFSERKSPPTLILSWPKQSINLGSRSSRA